MTDSIKGLRQAVLIGILLLFSVVMLFPFVWMVSTSFKSGVDVFGLSLIPQHPTFKNYIRLFEMSAFPRWFFNSLFVGFTITVSVLFFDSLVGYTLAKFRFPGREVVFIFILATMMIPTEMLVIPWYVMSNGLHWTNTYWGVMFPGVISGFGTFLMRQFFYSVPDDLIESGRIDGLNEFLIWSKIAMPLVRPALAALAIFAFVGNWNAFLWPLIVSSDAELFTLPVGLAYFSGEFQSEWEMVMTGASVATIPVFIVFLIFQNQIIKGIALTGMKE